MIVLKNLCLDLVFILIPMLLDNYKFIEFEDVPYLGSQWTLPLGQKMSYQVYHVGKRTM